MPQSETELRPKILAKNQFLIGLCILYGALSMGCGAGGPGAGAPSSQPSVPACTSPTYDSSAPFSPHESHAFIIVEENASFETVLGNPNMPYLNTLAQKYAHAEGYFADAHPSAPDYFMLTAGEKITDNDEFTATVANDNIVRHLIAAGKTWKEYSEDLPSIGYDGPDLNLYIEHHNPLSYFSDVRNDPTQLLNLVPFTDFFTDLDNHTLPNYAFIVPDNSHDAHSCLLTMPNCTEDQKLAVADMWLKDNVDPLITSPDFNQPGGGILIITFDESNFTDTRMHGGHVLWVVVGADVKKGHVSTICYQHESTLRFMSQVLGLPGAPGEAALAPDMRDFLIGN